LTAAAREASRIDVWCGETGVLIVRVVTPRGELTGEVQRRSEHVEDDVVWGVEAQLEQLGQAPTPAPVPAPAPVVSSTPPPAAPPVAASAPPPAPPPRLAEAYVSALTEYWDAWALGAEVGSSFGNGTWQYGLAFGGRLVEGEARPFRLSELSGALRVSLTLQRVVGLRVQLGVGPSVLFVGPTDGASADSGTVLSAAALELTLSRPFWFAKFGLSPALGARLFTARRTVNVDDQEAFVVPVVTPQASLTLLYRP
jgi:hypothetical protein